MSDKNAAIKRLYNIISSRLPKYIADDNGNPVENVETFHALYCSIINIYDETIKLIVTEALKNHPQK